MEKDFDKWNDLKKNLDKKEINRNLFYHEREIWWSSVGINIGAEANGKNDLFERPVLILNKFNSESILVLPLTTKYKNSRFYFKLENFTRDSWVNISQIKNISTKRLQRKIGVMDEENFKNLLTKLEEIIKTSKPAFAGFSEAEATNILSISNQNFLSNQNLTEIKLNVPYISQHRDIISKEWKNKACSITCLAMAINYFKQNKNGLFFEKDFNLNVNDILEDAIKFNFYDEKIAYWLHNKISLLPHNYGITCYGEEFKSEKLKIKTKYFEEIKDFGINKMIKNILENKLVIFSMPKGWEHKDKYHSSLMVGIKFKSEMSSENLEKLNLKNLSEKVLGFYYHDPDFEDEENGAFKYVELEKFKEHWRGLSIFVG